MNETSKNKGFSLIELVVTIAVMGIVVLISVNLYDLIRSADTKSAAENINTTLSSLRSKSLAKANEFKMCVEMDANGNYTVAIYEKKITVAPDGSSTEAWVVIESEKLGKKVTITVSDGAGAGAELDTQNSLEIQCSKSNGSFIRSKCVKSDGTEFDIKQIRIAKGSATKTVKLIISTGRHYID